jgi:hypothetical protein
MAQTTIGRCQLCGLLLVPPQITTSDVFSHVSPRLATIAAAITAHLNIRILGVVIRFIR